MEAPRYTVILPMLRFRPDQPALVSLRETAPSPGTVEIFVVEGEHPARQRNAALERARGEIIVFLDNDCRVAPHYWSELEAAFARPGVEIVGGPALLREGAAGLEQIFHALLTHPLVVGPVCSRYAPRGEFRAATQTELIMCNLAARTSLFTRIGPLSTELYPNEENEWLERAQVSGAGIFYDPKLQIFRPQRSTWGAMLKMLLRYGSGRTRQFWVSGWRATPYQVLPLILLLPIGAAMLGGAWLLGLGALWLLLALGVGATCRGLGLRQRIVAGLAAPVIPFVYAIGQLIGYPALLIASDADSEIRLLDERGQVLADSQIRSS